MAVNFIYYDTIDSTNNELKRRLNADDNVAEYTVISAGMQTSGRGRSGHCWESRQGVSVSTSMLLYPTELPGEAVAQITIPAAVAVCRSIKREFGLVPQIKWPNDVLLEQKKVCGILTERIGKAVIVGIGVNVLNGSYPSSLKDRAISIEEAARTETFGREVSDVLTKNIWEDFLPVYNGLLSAGNLSFLQQEYHDYFYGAGKIIRINGPGETFEAKALGIDENGRLLAEDKTGSIVVIDSGEVHVRGKDGYV